MAVAQAAPAAAHRPRRCLRLAGLTAVAVLRAGLPGPAWAGALVGRGPSAVGPRAGPQSRAGEKVARRAARPNKTKLEEEAMAMEGFLRQVTGFFSPKPQAPTKEEVQEAERRQKTSAATQTALQSLKLSVVAGEDDSGAPLRRAAPISVLQSQARQSLAIFGTTNEEAITDLLLSMRIAAKDFSERNILVVPVLINLDTKVLLELPPRIKDSKLMKQGAVALPAPKNDEESRDWGMLMSREFTEAYDQGMGDQAEMDGLGLLVKSTGEIVRRGVGRPDWQAIFKDLGL